MSQIYEVLGKKYGLSDKFKVLSQEEEIKKISIYQNPKTPIYMKNAIVEEFWNNHKSSIIKEAIKYYGMYHHKTSGNVSVDIEDMIQKGAMALTHCLNIYDIKLSKKLLKQKDKNKKSSMKFSTLLHWWLRPFILNRINQENYMIYVPHYKGSKHKSIAVQSLDAAAFTDSEKTKVDFIQATDPTPEQITEQTLFWDQVKQLIEKDEYDMLVHWLSYKKYFKNVKQLYKKYNMTPAKFKSKINKILGKIKAHKNEFDNWL